MPIIKSAKKAARQATKRTAHNVEIKKAIKAALKAFKANPTLETLAKAQSEYDKAVKKDLLKKNTAARRKAKLYKIAKNAGLKLEKKAKEVKKNTAKATAKAAKTVEKVAKDVEKTAKKVETKAKKVATKTTAPKAKAQKK